MCHPSILCNIGNSLLSTLSGSIPFTCRYLNPVIRNPSVAGLLSLPLQYISIIVWSTCKFLICSIAVCRSSEGKMRIASLSYPSIAECREAFCPKSKPITLAIFYLLHGENFCITFISAPFAPPIGPVM